MQQEPNEIPFNGVYYQPMEKGEPGVFEEGKEYVFKYPRPRKPRGLRIYECHVGMSNMEPVVSLGFVQRCLVCCGTQDG